MALSEFMPYGAPELIDGAASRLARSTLSASVAVLLLVAGLGAFSAQRGTHQIVQPEPIPMFRWIDPNVLSPQPIARPTPPQPRAADPGAIPNPVRELPAPPADVPDLDTPRWPGFDAREGATPTTEGSRDGVPAVEPQVGAYVYFDEGPVELHCVEARYPDLAREAGVEGTVKLLVLVGVDGHARRAIVRREGSIPLLDEAALASARTCGFTPALSNGHPVMVWVAKNYHFTLH